MKRTRQVLNILSVAFALIMNFIVGAQIIDVPSIGQVSDTYATFLTPSTYAFSIWSLIYLLLAVFAVYQARDLLKPNSDNDIPEKAGPYFILANIGNALWTYVFVSGLIGLSVLILVSMVLSLLWLLKRLDIALSPQPPVKVLVSVWWPLMLYTGWVLVASVVNIASWLAAIDITIPSLVAAFVLVILGCALLALLYTRNVRELLFASTWGIIAIGVNQLHSGGDQLVMITAFTVGIIALVATALHAYQNRNDNILSYLHK